MSLDFDRINYLINPDQFKDIMLTVVGVGSGGAPLVDHLTMNGLRNWHLYDHDTLEPVNLIKHPRRRMDIDRLKVKIQKEWILDRNPEANVVAFGENVIQSPNFEASVQASDFVLLCADNNMAREYVSDICVQNQTPFISGSVFRTGIGGEIYAYAPGETGCYRCLQLLTLKNNIGITEDQIGLTEEEEENIYGLNDKSFKASGLSIDIQMIALIHARMTLSMILNKVYDPNNPIKSKIDTLKANWIIFGNRPSKGIFTTHFESKQMILRPQAECNCHNISKQ